MSRSFCSRCYEWVERKPCPDGGDPDTCPYMQRVAMHGIDRGGNWNIDDDPRALARAVEWMRRQVALIADQGRWIIPRSGSVIVIDKTNKRAIRVLGLAHESSTQKVFEAMGWKWIDKAAGEKVDE